MEDVCLDIIYVNNHSIGFSSCHQYNAEVKVFIEQKSWTETGSQADLILISEYV